MMTQKLKLIGIITTLWSLAATASATGAGFYLGGALGETNTNNRVRTVQTTPPVTVDPSNTGLGARIFGGYAVNQYAAFEGGFTRYSPSTYNVSSSLLPESPTIRENGVDLVARGSYPIYDFSVFGKAGIAFIRESLAGSLNTNPGQTNGTSTYIRPIGGIGVGYDFSANWVGELSYTRVFKGGNFQNADFISLGVSYHFVDKYCGQFLC